MNLILYDFSIFQIERRQRREIAETKAKEAKSKIRTNYLKMLVIQQLRGEQSKTHILIKIISN